MACYRMKEQSACDVMGRFQRRPSEMMAEDVQVKSKPHTNETRV